MNKNTDQLIKIGAQIRRLREAHGLNLHELARLCGISASALSLIETGKRDLRVSSLLRIAGALRTAPAEILDQGLALSSEAQSDPAEGYDLSDYS